MISFSGQTQLCEFIVRANHRTGRGVVFAQPDTGRLYAIPKAAARTYTILEPEA